MEGIKYLKCVLFRRQTRGSAVEPPDPKKRQTRGSAVEPPDQKKVLFDHKIKFRALKPGEKDYIKPYLDKNEVLHICLTEV